VPPKADEPKAVQPVPVDSPAAEAAVASAVQQGIAFLESAVRSGTPASAVADTALSLFPKDGLSELAKQEPATVLADIERAFGPDSILLTIPGQKFVGEFIEALRTRLAG
jgi:hypothetical protein